MHSTVYNVKGVEASNNLFNFLKEHDPDHNTSWFELGERVGIEIVDEEEVDAEEQEIEEDKEVERIYNDAKDKHRQMLTGTCIFSVLSKVLCMEYYVFNHTDTCCLMSEVSKVHCTECKRMNGTMSEVSKEIKYKHVLLGGLSLHLNHLYSIAHDNLRLAIWDTSFWTFLVKFGHKGP